MQKMKKALSLFLALVMIFGALAPVGAYATSPTPLNPSEDTGAKVIFKVGEKVTITVKEGENETQKKFIQEH